MADIRRILVPVDFSETSEKAADYAMDLASKLGASLSFVHVYQIPVYATPDGAMLVGPDFVAKVSESSQAALDGLLARYQGKGVEVSGRIADGPPHTEIERLVDELGADLIVMGTHGRTGVKHLLLGSVAERVVRTSKIPVVTIRTP